jgi:hypothetical protein
MKISKSATMFVKVEEWKKSGLSLREFASSVGLSTSKLDYWVRKKRKLARHSPAFVELTPLVKSTVNVESTSKYPDTDNQAQIVFTFPSGMCIKVYG